MKVLFVTNVPSPYRVDFFNCLGELCDLTVLFETSSAKTRNKKWQSSSFNHFKAVFLKGIRLGEAEAISFDVIPYLSKKKYDIIVVGMYSSPTGMVAIEYMKLMKIPFIISSDGGYIKSDDNRIKKYIKTRYISAAEYWLSTGKRTTEYLCYYGAKEDKVCIYPFTSVKYDDILCELISETDKVKYREKLGILEKKVVISVGQFIYRKGYDLLLESCANLNDDIGVYIIGGRAPKQYLEIVEQLKTKNIHFVDFMTKDRLKEFYIAADMFVLPTREDIWGLVVNEAMAFGLPVITTDCCVAGVEMVKNGYNGYIGEISQDYSMIINKIYNDREQLNRMQKNSLVTAKGYTIEKMASVHKLLFERIMKEA